MDLATAILTVGIQSITLLIGWKLGKRRLFNGIRQEMNDYMAELIADALEHPEKLKPIIDSLVKSGLKSFGLDKPPNFSIKAGDFKIGDGFGRMLAPYLARFAEKQVGSAATSAAEKAVESAFG